MPDDTARDTTGIRRLLLRSRVASPDVLYDDIIEMLFHDEFDEGRAEAAADGVEPSHTGYLDRYKVVSEFKLLPSGEPYAIRLFYRSSPFNIRPRANTCWRRHWAAMATLAAIGSEHELSEYHWPVHSSGTSESACWMYVTLFDRPPGEQVFDIPWGKNYGQAEIKATVKFVRTAWRLMTYLSMLEPAQMKGKG